MKLLSPEYAAKLRQRATAEHGIWTCGYACLDEDFSSCPYEPCPTSPGVPSCARVKKKNKQISEPARR